MRFFSYMLRVITVDAIALAIMIAYASAAHAQDVLPVHIGPLGINGKGGAIDYSGPYPMDNTEYSPASYRIFLVECNNGECYGPTGEDIGDERTVASQLPAIKAVDAQRATYRCHYVCVDSADNLVGSNPGAVDSIHP